MKTLLSLFLLLALGASAATGIKISEYPNTPVLTNSELFIVAVTNVTPATNRNISYGQLRSLLSSNNFVGSFTGDGRNASNVVAGSIAASNVVSGGTLIVSNATFSGSVQIGAPNYDSSLGGGMPPPSSLEVQGRILAGNHIIGFAETNGGGGVCIAAGKNESYLLANWYYGLASDGSGIATDRSARNGSSGNIIFAVTNSPSQGFNAGDWIFNTGGPINTPGNLVNWSNRFQLFQSGGANLNGKLNIQRPPSDVISITNSQFSFGDFELTDEGLIGQLTVSAPYTFVLQVQDKEDIGAYPLALNPRGGNVGVGVTKPASTLDVGGNISASGAIIATNGVVAAGGYFTGDGRNASNVVAFDWTYKPWINVKEPAFGAIGNGVSDDTAPIQLAMSSGKHIYIPAGTYNLSTNLFPSSGSIILGEGSRSVLKAISTNVTEAIYAIGLSNIVIRDIKLDFTSAGGNGIVLASVQHAVVDNVIVDSPGLHNNNSGYGIWLYRTGDTLTNVGLPCVDVTVRNCHILCATDVGIELYGAVDCDVMGNKVSITNTAIAGVYAWMGSSNCVIIGNSISGITNDAGRGIYISGCDPAFKVIPTHGIIVMGNTVRNVAYGISTIGVNVTNDVENTLIKNNVITANVGGLFCAWSDGIVFAGNDVQASSAAMLSPTSYGYPYNTAKNIIFEDNRLMSDQTITLYGNYGGSFSRNRISVGTNTTHVVRFYGWTGCIINENLWRDIGSGGSQFGLILNAVGGVNCNSNSVCGNLAFDSRPTPYTVGIYVTDGSDYNLIANNANYGQQGGLGCVYSDSTGTHNTFYNNVGAAFSDPLVTMASSWMLGSSNISIGSASFPQTLFVNGTNGNVGFGTQPMNQVHMARTGLCDFGMSDPGESSNQKNWAWQVGTSLGSGVMRLRIINDARTDGANAVVFTRSGYTGVSTAFPAGPVSVTGDINSTGNISASGAMIATNAFVMPPVSAGPVWCTNGLAAMWNSNNNGQATIYLRTSAVGATTYADKLVAP